jgi:hypothetical protein
VPTPVQTAQMIRYALGTLGADNAHHQFEHLCRHLARRRIASNVLPATGPVSAGGDQGRDFETFRTYLAEELPFAIGFLALASSDVVVFACTIQKDKLRRKFEDDIKSVCTQGTRVDRIYIFATASVTTILRHDLQEWAAREHTVAVEIIDEGGLAEWLAEPDLYWIAEQYLHLPAGLAPQAEQADEETRLPAWYIELRAYWQEPGRQPVTLGDLFDLRQGLRHATRRGPARADLAGWLALMTRLAERTPYPDARLRAIYEIAAARVQGAAELRPADPLIRRLIDEVQRTDDPALLLDASVLIQFCATAAGLGHTGIPMAEATGWTAPLRNHIGQLLERDLDPNTRACLLHAAAHAALHIDFTKAETGAEAEASTTPEDIDRMYSAVTEAIEQGTLQTHLPPAPVTDLDAGMRHLAALTGLLPDAPAYPIDALALLVDLLAPTLRDHPLYRQVCDGLDRAVARQEGDAAAGDRCRQRAEALQAAGRPLDALREFHQAKINWFHGDTLYGTLRAMACITDIYAGLGMYLAGKKYALAMASLALSSQDASDRELAPIALFSAANMDHLAGAWAASAELAATAGQAHLRWAPDPFNLERHAYVAEAIKYQAFAAVIAQQTRPGFLPAIHGILRGSILDGLTRPPAASPATEPLTELEWTDRIADKAGAPFSDAGPIRSVAFHALGVRWAVHGRNDQDTVLALEDFTSALQILLAEFASLDPVLIQQDIDVEIGVYPPGRPPADTYLTRVHHDGRRLWRLFLPAGLPPGASADEATPGDPELGDAARLAFLVLAGNSLLGPQSFTALIEQAARNGLFSNLDIGRPYHELTLLRSQPIPPLAGPQHRPLANAQRPNPRAGSPHTGPRTGPGTGYSAQQAHSLLAQRYAILPVPVRHTIPALLADTRVRAVFLELRDAGWKDWHLLSVVANLTINHRLALRPAITEGAARKRAEAFDAEARRPEEPGDPRIESGDVTREAMEAGIQLVAVSSLHYWDLTLAHGTTKADPIVRLLGERYGFWEDDVPHADPFHGQLTLGG